MVWCIDKNSQTNSKSQNLGFDIHDHILEQGFGKFSSVLNMYICTYDMYAPGQKAAICGIWLPIFGSDEY